MYEYCWQSDALENCKEEEHPRISNYIVEYFFMDFMTEKRRGMAYDNVVCTFVKVFGWEAASLFYLWFKNLLYSFTTYNHPITPTQAVSQLRDLVFLIFNMYSYQAVLEILQFI